MRGVWCVVYGVWCVMVDATPTLCEYSTGRQAGVWRWRDFCRFVGALVG